MGVKLALNRLLGGSVNGQQKLARAERIASAAFAEAEASQDMEGAEAERLLQLAAIAKSRAKAHARTVRRARSMAEAAHQ